MGRRHRGLLCGPCVRLRHKLAPFVSPHKTVEGAVGGVLGSMAAGCVLTLVYSLLSAKYNVMCSAFRCSRSIIWCCWAWVPWHRCWAFWVTCLRRPSSARSGIKDYGTIFPGHGGILDRFDSVMFIAPFVSIAVRYFFYLL